MSNWINVTEYEKKLIKHMPSIMSSEEGLPDNHTIVIRERELSVDFPQLIQNNVRTDTVTLDLDAEWNGIHPVIIFGDTEEYGTWAVQYFGDPVHIPAKAMEHIGGLDLSVMGLDDSGLIRLVTKAAPDTFEVIESGEYIGNISEDDASLLGQILATLTELEDLKQQLEELIAAGGGGVTDYNQLTNKPSIEGITLSGDLSMTNFGLSPISNEDLDSILS